MVTLKKESVICMYIKNVDIAERVREKKDSDLKKKYIYLRFVFEAIQ